MNKFVAIATAGVIAISASLAVTAQSEAFFPKYGFAAGILGFAAGAALATAAAQDHWYHDGYFGGPGWDDHVQACEDAYRSYNFHTDTYVRRIDGQLQRVYCEL